MTDERRYDRTEVAEIFGAAAAPRQPRPGEADGLTLAELQEIGREVGVAPERVAEAAAGLEVRRGALPRRTALGMPMGVSRVVELARAPTDREWALLVTELRETFQAQGRDTSRGELRAWSNGNLRALVEPTETGWRLRLATRNGRAAALNRVAALTLATAVGLALLFLLQGGGADDAVLPLLLALLAASELGFNALRLPGWAAEREAQMEQVAARAHALLAAPPRDG